jgi:hypothetical protein
MRKIWFPLLLLVALVLASCAQATPAPTAVPTSPPAPTTPPAAATNAPSGSNAIVGPVVECKVTGAQFAAPPVTKDDWVNGSPDAKFTIIEYSDYQ